MNPSASTMLPIEAKYGRLKNYINGGFVASHSDRSLAVHCPLDGSLLAVRTSSSLATARSSST